MNVTPTLVSIMEPVQILSMDIAVSAYLALLVSGMNPFLSPRIITWLFILGMLGLHFIYHNLMFICILSKLGYCKLYVKLIIHGKDFKYFLAYNHNIFFHFSFVYLLLIKLFHCYFIMHDQLGYTNIAVKDQRILKFPT